MDMGSGLLPSGSSMQAASALMQTVTHLRCHAQQHLLVLRRPGAQARDERGQLHSVHKGGGEERDAWVHACRSSGLRCGGGRPESAKAGAALACEKRSSGVARATACSRYTIAKLRAMAPVSGAAGRQGAGGSVVQRHHALQASHGLPLHQPPRAPHASPTCIQRRQFSQRQAQGRQGAGALVGMAQDLQHLMGGDRGCGQQEEAGQEFKAGHHASGHPCTGCPRSIPKAKCVLPQGWHGMSLPGMAGLRCHCPWPAAHLLLHCGGGARPQLANDDGQQAGQHLQVRGDGGKPSARCHVQETV